MKKIIVIFLVFSLALIACGTNTVAATTETASMPTMLATIQTGAAMQTASASTNPVGTPKPTLGPNAEHLAKLMEGVDAWNAWRKQNPDVRPDLTKADLSQANLQKIDLSRAKLTFANLQGANLSKAKLGTANLKGANLANAILRGALLKKAHLPNAKLKGADLSSANLSGADLTGADLTDAKLTGAKYDSATLWPAGFDPVAAGAVLVAASTPTP